MAKSLAYTTMTDNGEPTSRMEPMRIPASAPQRPELTDLALTLATRSTGFQHSLPAGILTALADLVRAMNCYYSNLIEGHNTHPVDIERALRDDYSTPVAQRNLQLEAKAHITVQTWIDHGGLRQRMTSLAGLCETHRRFAECLPPELLHVESPDTGERGTVIPGQLRQRDVKVGQHVAVSPGTLPRFLHRFDQVYGRLGKAETLIGAAAAHHRLLWIHPFLDGNGRVARLMSHASLRETLDTGGIWSIARGLARNVHSYKAHLAACDQPRRNDLDGRGHLSEAALVSFSRFFLETCIDQVDFMEQLTQPHRLKDRIALWAEEQMRANALPANSGHLLEAILYRGELPRNAVAGLLDVSERHARRSVAALIEQGAVRSNSTRAPLTIAFPAKLAGRWMPGLFPAY